MAGPSVVVRVLGDLTGFSKSMDSTAKKGADVAGSLRSGFGTVFSTLNTTGVLSQFTDVFTAIDGGLNQLEEHGHRVATALQAAGTVAAATGFMLARLGSADQQAQQQLQQAVDNTGASWADYQSKVEAAIKSEERYGNTAVSTQDALRVLTQATNDPAKAMNLLSLATDLAAAKHESLTAASTQLARAVNGSTRLLKEFGITVPKVGTKVGDFATKTDQANYIVAELSSRLHGEASAAANTFMGHIHALTAVIEDHAAAIGQKWGPALTGIGSAVTVVSTAYKTYESILARAKAAQEAQTVVTEEQTVATEGLTVAETAADGAGAPIALIVIGIAAAVAALALAAYEVYRHWKTIWGGIKDAVSAVWDWIKHNWPLLVGIILGPIGIIASQIYMHWDTIKSTFIDAFEAIKAYVLGLPAWFGRLFTNVGTAIVDALKAAFNAVAGLWNHSVGSLSFKVPGWVPFVGGDKFSVPQIPHLAQGGLITQTGFVYAHAGEAITPANKALGPAVHIEHAQFNEPVDLDLLIKRVEFALTAGLPV